MEFRTGYNYDRDAVSLETGLAVDSSECQVQEQFKDDCDINTIVRRFGLTGQVPENFRMPVSGDFSGIGDFQSAMELVRASEDAFMTLPASLRSRFGHSPQQLLEFLGDAGNRDEAVRLGLVAPPQEVDKNGDPLPSGSGS